MAFQIDDGKPLVPTGGRPPGRPVLSTYEVRQEAQRLLRDNRLSPAAMRVLDVLAVVGVVTDAQLYQLVPMSRRSLQRYHRQHLLDRLAATAPTQKWLSLDSGSWLYTLGAVGEEVARWRIGRVPKGYADAGVDRVTHDVLCNEAALRVVMAARGLGWAALWRSRYEATMHDEAGRPVVEPDALLVLTHGAERRPLLLEFHHEDTRRRVEEKVRKYEAAYRDGYWQSVGGTEAPPTVLVVWTHRIVGTAYKEAIEKQRALGLRCAFLGKPWEAVVSGEQPGRWFSFNRGEMVDLLG